MVNVNEKELKKALAFYEKTYRAHDALERIRFRRFQTDTDQFQSTYYEGILQAYDVVFKAFDCKEFHDLLLTLSMEAQGGKKE